MSCSDGDLEVGENLAAIGNEVIQFRHATPLGAGRFRLCSPASRTKGHRAQSRATSKANLLS